MSFLSVITLANSIIGVAILSMPYCFKQCGIILAIVMILCSGMLVKVTCHLLLKSALLARRRNFENLAFHTFGTTGKLLIELGIIGYLVGVTIAFFVVMGDLGPPIIANLTELENSGNLRLVILTALGLFVALPLSLIRNIASLQYICTASIGFYVFVVLRVVLESTPQLKSGQWMSEVNLWRPSGMLQCFPIFSMALACQTNIFEVYASLPDATPGKMTEITKGAVNVCTLIYITIGFFGYVAFYANDVGGDILTNFEHSNFIQMLKMGFCISVALSFPLVMFPCRTSVHSLLFRKTYQGIGSTELVTDYIPPARFNLITVCLILTCLTVGILIPDIELVLGFVGSTMGASVCVIFPGAVFLKLSNKETTERLAARAVLVIGVVMLILGSYVNLEEASRSSSTAAQYSNGAFVQPAKGMNDPKEVDKAKAVDQEVKEKIEKVANDIIKNVSKESGVKKLLDDESKDSIRVEPAVPEEPKLDKVEDIVAKEASEEKEESNKINKKKVVPKEDTKERLAKDAKDDVKPDPIVERDKKDLDTKDDLKSDEDKVDADKLLKELKRQKEESELILEKQKEILKELQDHKKEDQQQPVQQAHQQAEMVQQQVVQNVQQPIQTNQQQLNQQQQVIQNVQQPIQTNQQLNQQHQVVQSVQQPIQTNQQQQQMVQQQQVVQNVQQPIQSNQQQVIQNVQQPIQTNQQQQQVVQQQIQMNQQQNGQQQPVVQNQNVPAEPNLFNQNNNNNVPQQQIVQQQAVAQNQNVPPHPNLFNQNNNQNVQQQNLPQNEPQMIQQQQQQQIPRKNIPIEPKLNLGINQKFPSQNNPQPGQQPDQNIQLNQQNVQQQIIQQQPNQMVGNQLGIQQQQSQGNMIVNNNQQQQQVPVQQQQQQFQYVQSNQNQNVPQNVQQNVPQKQDAQQNIQQNIQQNVQQQNVQQNVQQSNQQLPQQQVQQKPGTSNQLGQSNQVLQQPSNQQPQQQPQQQKQLPVNNLNYNVNADVKYAMEAYDQEQRDLIKPVESKAEKKSPGRDILEVRSKRFVEEAGVMISTSDQDMPSESSNCLNDPFCDDKFFRDPASDSLSDGDLTKFLKVGNSRALLEAGPDTSNNSEKVI